MTKNDVSNKPKAKKSAKIYAKSWLLWYRILHRVKKGMYQQQIADSLKMERRTVSYHLGRLQALGYVKSDFRTSYKSYVMTQEGTVFLRELRQRQKFSLPTSDKKVRSHALTVKFPILVDNPNAKWETQNTGLNNWIQKFDKKNFPIGVTIERTTKNIKVHFHEFPSKQSMFLTEFVNHVMRGWFYVVKYCEEEKGIKIDFFNGETTHQHIANESPELEGKIDPKLTVSKRLGRKATSIFPSNMDAKAWLDRSKGIPEIETNDIIYEEKLLAMPERIDDVHKVSMNVLKNLDYYAKNQASHVATVKTLDASVNLLSEVTISLRDTMNEFVKEVRESKKKNG